PADEAPVDGAGARASRREAVDAESPRERRAAPSSRHAAQSARGAARIRGGLRIRSRRLRRPPAIVVRAVVQRVSSASVTAEGRTARIGAGLLVLVGVERGDGPDDVDYIVRKTRELRAFDESDKSFHRSVQEIDGEVLVVSQFTLAADCRKGRRPSFDDAAPPEIARPLYESVVIGLTESGLKVETGRFQAMMQVSLVNDGPVTLLLDSRKRF